MVLCKILHLLVRDVSGNITCMLSMKKEVGVRFFAQHLYHILENSLNGLKSTILSVFKR